MLFIWEWISVLEDVIMHYCIYFHEYTVFLLSNLKNDWLYFLDTIPFCSGFPGIFLPFGKKNFGRTVIINAAVNSFYVCLNLPSSEKLCKGKPHLFWVCLWSYKNQQNLWEKSVSLTCIFLFSQFSSMFLFPDELTSIWWWKCSDTSVCQCSPELNLLAGMCRTDLWKSCNHCISLSFWWTAK